MSNHYLSYSATSGYGFGEYGYGGYGYGNGMISEREKALEREKKQWHLERTQYEEQWQKEQKRFKQRGWKWTGELWQRAARLNEREEEIIKREMELAEHEKEMARYEAALEEEKIKILEQYKRVKKLERQGKRREERIQQAKHRLQQQANEHFSVVYKTLQLGINRSLKLLHLHAIPFQWRLYLHQNRTLFQHRDMSLLLSLFHIAMIQLLLLREFNLFVQSSNLAITVLFWLDLAKSKLLDHSTPPLCQPWLFPKNTLFMAAPPHMRTRTSSAVVTQKDELSIKRLKTMRLRATAFLVQHPPTLKLPPPPLSKQSTSCR